MADDIAYWTLGIRKQVYVSAMDRHIGGGRRNTGKILGLVDLASESQRQFQKEGVLLWHMNGIRG